MPKQEEQQQSAEQTKGEQKKPTEPQAKAGNQADCQKSCNKQNAEHEHSKDQKNCGQQEDKTSQN
jgi:hypothetical protein